MNIKYSQLLSQEERLKGEVKTLTDENEFYKKKNAEGVDIRRVPLMRQLEPGATQWQRISEQSRRDMGAPASWIRGHRAGRAR